MIAFHIKGTCEHNHPGYVYKSASLTNLAAEDSQATDHEEFPRLFETCVVLFIAGKREYWLWTIYTSVHDIK